MIQYPLETQEESNNSIAIAVAYTFIAKGALRYSVTRVFTVCNTKGVTCSICTYVMANKPERVKTKGVISHESLPTHSALKGQSDSRLI